MPPFEGPCLCGDPKCWKCGPYCGGDEDDDDALETTLGDVANALGVPLADRPEGIAGAAKTWRERAEAAEARVAEIEAALRWIPVTEALPEYGDGVEMLHEHFGRLVGSKLLGGDLWWASSGAGGCVVAGITHWRPLLPGPEVKS